MPMRIFELASDLNLTSKVVLDVCRANGLEVKNHMAPVSSDLEQSIRALFGGLSDNAVPIQVPQSTIAAPASARPAQRHTETGVQPAAIDLIAVLKALADRRPVFHSEADFQHALAWIIHEQHPSFNVRLEYRPGELNQKTYVDIWIEHAGAICAIELKYKTRCLQVTVGEEPFDLLDQSAQDHARYDFCKDIGRIETLASACPGLTGFAVLLTNDAGYWRNSGRAGNADQAFRLHEAAKLTGRLEWASHASAATTKGRTDAICLRGEYPLTWTTYSKCGDQGNSDFRMAVASISPAQSAPSKLT